ncbi:unnamed protein product [Litomosoides sigmodontis]|uniref:Cystatin domain-containing protein n=1 Tax=Litomosoides sigmodontis TaxID=42156 RepID=A0A3P6TI22_LITSI|nr:unnamed protein product [Litomosoides sigmodontis]
MWRYSQMLQFILFLALLANFSNGQHENDQDVKDVVNKSMMKINNLMEGRNLWKLRKIVRANILVVESTIYRVTLRLTPTTCKKSKKIKKLAKCRTSKKLQDKTINVRISESMTGKITVKMV